jgi:hypothetical protein
MKRRIQVSEKTYTYLNLIRVYYFPEMTNEKLLENIVEHFEKLNELKKKLLES